MPSGSSLIAFTYVNIMFMVQLFVLALLANVKDVKDNWSLYRCNPLFMGLSDNIAEDFTYCVQNMQTDYFSVLIQPMNVIVGGLSSLGTTISNNIASITDAISDFRFNVPEIFKGVITIFENIIVVSEQLSMNLIDILKRFIATILVSIYGTITSIYAMGTIGGMIVYLSKGDIKDIVCFSPHTLLTLESKKQLKIKHIKIGDVLENGSKVTGILKLKNNQPMYKLKSKASSTNIYVTGKHFILNNNKFVHVEEHPDFILSNKTCSTVYNLMTDNNLIPIQNYLFWDYNDDILN